MIHSTLAHTFFSNWIQIFITRPLYVVQLGCRSTIMYFICKRLVLQKLLKAEFPGNYKFLAAFKLHKKCKAIRSIETGGSHGEWMKIFFFVNLPVGPYLRQQLFSFQWLSLIFKVCSMFSFIHILLSVLLSAGQPHNTWQDIQISVCNLPSLKVELRLCRKNEGAQINIIHCKDCGWNYCTFPPTVFLFCRQLVYCSSSFT